MEAAAAQASFKFVFVNNWRQYLETILGDNNWRQYLETILGGNNWRQYLKANT